MAEENFDDRVDAYIEKAAPFAQPVLAHLRKLMHKACPRVNETIKWRMPFFLQQGVILGHMAAFKQHCALGLWGTEMKKLLAKDGYSWNDGMGSLGRITSVKDLPPDNKMLAYMTHAAELVESGQRKKSINRPVKSVRRAVHVPAELASALRQNKTAAKVFEEFSPSCRREYAEWIAEAKRPETKEKRITQAIAWIAQGKSRHWKYQNC